MKFKLFVSSLFNGRNIAIFFILMIVSSIANSKMGGELFLPFRVAAIIIYLGFVIQNFNSKKFQEKFLRKMKGKDIKKLDKICTVLANDAKRHINVSYFKKLNSILNDKNAIMKSYYRGGLNYFSEKITEKTLNLVISYIKLLKSFCIRNKELNSIDIKPVIERVTKNTRKLGFINDSKVRENVQNMIEMDEKVLSRIKDEKLDLERIDTRLDYIKSTVYMLRQRVNLKLESDDFLEKIEEAVNEAIALENVLDKRNKNGIRI